MCSKIIFYDYITSSSHYFYPTTNNIFEDINNNIIKNNYKEKIDEIINFVNDNNLLNVIEHVATAPNKQMGMFKNGWDKIKMFRDKKHSYLYNRKSEYKKYVPDVATSVFIKKSPYYFIFSFVPRSNDIGLYNELGCTYIYAPNQFNSSTTKYLTSDNFEKKTNIYQTKSDLDFFKLKTIIDS